MRRAGYVCNSFHRLHNARLHVRAYNTRAHAIPNTKHAVIPQQTPTNQRKMPCEQNCAIKSLNGSHNRCSSPRSGRTIFAIDELKKTHLTRYWYSCMAPSFRLLIHADALPLSLSLSLLSPSLSPLPPASFPPFSYC